MTRVGNNVGVVVNANVKQSVCRGRKQRLDLGASLASQGSTVLSVGSAP